MCQHFSKYFAFIHTFNPYHGLLSYYYYLHFTDKDVRCRGARPPPEVAVLQDTGHSPEPGVLSLLAPAVRRGGGCAEKHQGEGGPRGPWGSTNLAQEKYCSPSFQSFGPTMSQCYINGE